MVMLMVVMMAMVTVEVTTVVVGVWLLESLAHLVGMVVWCMVSVKTVMAVARRVLMAVLAVVS